MQVESVGILAASNCSPCVSDSGVCIVFYAFCQLTSLFSRIYSGCNGLVFAGSWSSFCFSLMVFALFAMLTYNVCQKHVDFLVVGSELFSGLVLLCLSSLFGPLD